MERSIEKVEGINVWEEVGANWMGDWSSGGDGSKIVWFAGSEARLDTHASDYVECTFKGEASTSRG